MLPRTPRDVHAVRTAALWLVRAAAFCLLAAGVYLTLHRVLFAVGSGMGLVEMFQTWEGIGEGHSFYRGLSMLAVGGVLAGLSRTFSHWMIPMVAYACPGCGYEPPKTADGERCPECGLAGAFRERTS